MNAMTHDTRVGPLSSTTFSTFLLVHTLHNLISFLRYHTTPGRSPVESGGAVLRSEGLRMHDALRSYLRALGKFRIWLSQPHFWWLGMQFEPEAEMGKTHGKFEERTKAKRNMHVRETW